MGALIAGAASVAVLELLDRDGHVRQSVAVPHWPLRIGRALDNDVVLSDPHVAAHHLVLEPSGAAGLAALLHGRVDVRGERVGVVLSGGNVGLERFSSLVSA